MSFVRGPGSGCGAGSCAAILQKPPCRLQYVDHVDGRGAEFFEQWRNMGLEGMLWKRTVRNRRPGRGDDWIKVKCNRRV
jgi:bifunctional non-homologous end joining protein LigD